MHREAHKIDDAAAPEAADPPWFRMKAALVHLYTASGVVLALLTVAAAFRGETIQALWLMLAALLVDGTDGLLARRFRVEEALPFLDGEMLDNIVDYITYVFAPVVLLWSGGYLPAGDLGLAVAVVPLLASSYQFCHVDAKTDDHFFLGFPSYFNVMALYVVVFDLGVGGACAVMAFFSLLVFIPVRYVYPTRTAVFRRLSLLLTTLWLFAWVAVLLGMPEPAPILLVLSLAYPAYYFGLSFYLSARMFEARRLEEQRTEPSFADGTDDGRAT